MVLYSFPYFSAVGKRFLFREFFFRPIRNIQFSIRLKSFTTAAPPGRAAGNGGACAVLADRDSTQKANRETAITINLRARSAPLRGENKGQRWIVAPRRKGEREKQFSFVFL